MSNRMFNLAEVEALMRAGLAARILKVNTADLAPEDAAFVECQMRFGEAEVAAALAVMGECNRETDAEIMFASFGVTVGSVLKNSITFVGSDAQVGCVEAFASHLNATLAGNTRYGPLGTAIDLPIHKVAGNG